MNSSTPPPYDVGDMPPEEFRRYAHELADWMADYLAHVGDLPVLARVEPGEIAASLPAEAPTEPTPMDAILRDFRELLMPGVTHWNHPDFFAYFAITGSGPGILGEMISAALNVNAMLWRTGPAATELEERAVDWLRQMLGLPAHLRGVLQDTASLSTVAAMIAARERALPDVRENGLGGHPRLRAYCSAEAHNSVDKAGVATGIGRAGTRRIPTDDHFRMDPAALSAAIEEDRAAGWLPFFVTATVGTTSTTSIDPVPAIADVCERHGLWLHVDGAYGGTAAVAPEFRYALDGCERADSIVVNPHKWLFVPVDCSVLLFRDAALFRRSLTVTLDMLVTPEDEHATNLMDYGLALGRRFRALKLWMVLRYFGQHGLAARIREHARLARLFAEWVDEDPDWERLAPVPFSTVVFRRVPQMAPADGDAEALNQRILEAVNESGKAFLSHTRVRGTFALRLAVGNLRTTEANILQVWELLRHFAKAGRDGRSAS